MFILHFIPTYLYSYCNVIYCNFSLILSNVKRINEQVLYIFKSYVSMISFLSIYHHTILKTGV